MQTSLSRLAETLDSWVASGQIGLTETSAEIALNGLSAPDAVAVVALGRSDGWRVEVADGTDMPVQIASIAEEFEPFRAVLAKPDDVSGTDRLVTLAGLADRLRRDPGCQVLRAVRCETRFDARSLRICPLDDMEPFEAAPATGSPRKVVREMGDTRLAPADIGHWLLADPEGQPTSDPAFQVWAAIAAPHLLRCLSNEVTSDTLVLRGPPIVTLEMPATVEPNTINTDGFLGLPRAAAWVYESDRDLDTRHGLFTAEVARAAVSERNAASAFARLAAPALASAKIAYSVVLSGVNRDTLKALADLRKAVTDETGKLADAARSLAGTVATTVFAGIGLVLARLKADLPAWAVAFLALVLLLYVLSVIWSGWSFVRIQRDIRSQWRGRLYSFLEAAEYAEMVDVPVAKAECGFKLAAWAGGILITLLCAVLVAFAVFEIRATASAKAMAAQQQLVVPPPPALVPHPLPPATVPQGAAVPVPPAPPPVVVPAARPKASPQHG